MKTKPPFTVELCCTYQLLEKRWKQIVWAASKEQHFSIACLENNLTGSEEMGRSAFT